MCAVELFVSAGVTFDGWVGVTFDGRAGVTFDGRAGGKYGGRMAADASEIKKKTTLPKLYI